MGGMSKNDVIGSPGSMKAEDVVSSGAGSYEMDQSIDENMDQDMENDGIKAPQSNARSSSNPVFKSEAHHETLLDWYDRTHLPSSYRFLHFKRLEWRNIRYLESELVRLQQEESEDSSAYDANRVGEALHRYTTALRDCDFMRCDVATDCTASPQWISSTYLSRFRRGNQIPHDPLRKWLMKILPRKLTWTQEEKGRRTPNEWWYGAPPLTVSPFVDGLARFIVAFTGGISLVIPMLIMRIHQSTCKSLITTSVAVLLFASVVSILFKASNSETLGITAAYAAVLVVFVGTSSGSG